MVILGHKRQVCTWLQVSSVLLSVHPSPALVQWSWLSGTQGWPPQLSWHTANAPWASFGFQSAQEGLCKWFRAVLRVLKCAKKSVTCRLHLWIFVISGLLSRWCPIVQWADHQKPLGSDIPGSGSAPSRPPDTCPSLWPALHQSGWLRSSHSYLSRQLGRQIQDNDSQKNLKILLQNTFKG